MPDSPSPRASPSAFHKLIFAAILGVCTLLLLEICTRVVFALRVGPSVLAYGLMASRDKVTAQGMTDGVGAGYTKYSPNQVRYDSDPATGEKFQVTINSRGFRGRDFETEKEPEVLRVLTLGASSTFGYRDRDDETYPHYLEILLNEKCSGSQRYEVINLGIPQLLSKQLRALFLAEGLELAPDIVTFYEGVNDAEGDNREPAARESLRRISLLRSTFRFARDHFLLVNLLNQLGSRPQSLELEKLEPHFDEKAKRFVENLASIRSETEAAGATFLVANQQLKSYLVPVEEIRSLTYEEEGERVRDKLARLGRLEPKEVSFLAHQRIMEELERWVAEEDVPFVDVIALTDRERDILVSRVHLSPRGNQLVAEAFAEPILERTCRPQESDTPVDSDVPG